MRRLENRKIRIILIFVLFTFICVLSSLYLSLNYYPGLNSQEPLINNFNCPMISYLNPNIDTISNSHESSKDNWTCPAGKVLKSGPYGNKNSSVKIAYLIGVHPAEQSSHQAIYNAILKNQANLKYCYYIYKIQVNCSKDYNKNRYYGQLLAYKYAISDINKNKFNMVVDVHSNQGKYAEKTFVFTAIPNNESLLIAHFLVKHLPGLSYYIPSRTNEPTSAPYISEPLIKNGTPTIVYETYRYEPVNITEKKANDFIIALDDYKFDDK